MTEQVTASSLPVRAFGEPQKHLILDEICPWCQESMRVLKPSGGCLTADIAGMTAHPQCADAYETARAAASASPSDDGARQLKGSAGGARGEADARECDAGTPQSTGALTPPTYAVDLAVEVSGWSPCRSKRGVVIFSDGNVVSHGYNYKPRGFDCDGSAECKATCRREAVHAEQQALMSAGNRAHASEMLHVKTVDGKLVPSGGPSCVECSKLAWAARIAWVWLYHDTGWRRYTGREFHELSLRAAASDDGAARPQPAQEQQEPK